MDNDSRGPVTERPYAHPVGQAAYEAYKARAGGVSLVSGDSLPDWAALPEPVREAWDAAGMAARDVDLGS